MMCPLCGDRSSDHPLVDTVNGHSIYLCPGCGVIYSDPMKSPGGKWYEDSPIYAFRGLPQSLTWPHKQFLKGSYGKNLLDIGCGTGAFLEQAVRLGYEGYGIDFDHHNVAIALKRPSLAHVYPLTLESFIHENPSATFDAVTFFEVLEHMEEPIGFLHSIRTILSKNGYIGLSVPNIHRALDTGFCDSPPHHLTRWNAQSLRNFIERQGFEVVRLSIEKLSLQEIAGYFKNIISFGVATGLAHKGLQAGDADNIRRAAFLLRFKQGIFQALAVPAYLLSLPFRLQGMYIFCLARAR